MRNLNVYFPVKRWLSKSAYVRAVDNVTFTLHESETLAVVGESGSGKTTLGKCCLRLIEPTSGQIVYRGKDITKIPQKELLWYRKEAQIVYQDPFSSLNPFFTIRRTIEEPLIVHGVPSGPERRKMVEAALEDVKLTPVENFAEKYPHMLSGGQRQRVAIARAMILNPRFVVADEPVSMLDASVRVEILYLLRQLQEEHKISFIYITHDIATVKYFSERLAIMYAGKLVEVGPIRKVVSDPLHPYTKALIEAIPDPDPKNRFSLRKVPAGEPPDPTEPPEGCRFSPRCPIAEQVCRSREPQLREVEPGRFVACPP
ncbi:MAG: ABC transporter ATP-binding protein [Candidatus Bathyarchaeia archaeon]